MIKKNKIEKIILEYCEGCIDQSISEDLPKARKIIDYIKKQKKDSFGLLYRGVFFDNLNYENRFSSWSYEIEMAANFTDNIIYCLDTDKYNIRGIDTYEISFYNESEVLIEPLIFENIGMEIYKINNINYNIINVKPL